MEATDEQDTATDEQEGKSRKRQRSKAEGRSKTEGSQQADAQEPKFPKSRLVAQAPEFLGVSRHLAAGALAGIEDDKALTVPQAKGKVKQFSGG